MSGYTMYLYRDYRKRGYKDFRSYVVAICKQFKEKYGYSPRHFKMRQDDYEFEMGKEPLRLKLWVTLVAKGLQPGHISLGPVVKRSPIIKEVERTPQI